MNVSSPAFDHNQPIPPRFTCDGENISPPLEFSEVPDKAKSLALVMDDPDAPGGTFVHWLVWNIRPEAGEISEASDDTAILSGTNSLEQVGYGGPCPPEGQEHRYFFRLYALDTVLDLPSGSTHEQLNKAMGGHILSQADFFGVYRRND
jgi:Raf kinase inhibitor-like YbhB/YbcL family protein